MNRATAILLACGALLTLGITSAQRQTPILLVLPSGASMEHVLVSQGSGDDLVPTACYAASDAPCRMGYFTLDIEGAATDVPFDDIARADLVAPGAETVWRFTLKDGRTFDGVVDDAGARFYVNGLSDCCQNLILHAYPRRPDQQAFVSVVFAP